MARSLFVGLPGDGGASYYEVQTRIDRGIRVIKGEDIPIQLSPAVVRLLLVTKVGQASLIGLIGINQVLAGQEEAVAMVGARATG